MIGGRQVRPRQTIAHASAPAGGGTCSSVSASASGSPPGTSREASMRITVLLTAKPATASSLKSLRFRT